MPSLPLECCRCVAGIMVKLNRAIASLTVPGGQEFHFPHFFLKFRLIFLIFPQTLLIFFLILALRVGDSPTREGPGYATEVELLSYIIVYQRPLSRTGAEPVFQK